MEILLAPELAPLTFAWGFLEAPLGPIADALVEWSRRNTLHLATEPVRGVFPDLLRALEPLTFPQTKELLLPTKSEWTAYFDNGAQGAEPANAVGALAQMLGCRGISVMSVPDTPDIYGAALFHLYSPIPTEFLNLQREIGIINDGSRWRFANTGKLQFFEEPAYYGEKIIKRRFPSALLERYCAHFGIRLLDPDFYGSDGLLVKHLHLQVPELSLREAREKLGLP